MAQENPKALPSSLVRTLFPELGVLDAVAELREQIRSEKVRAKQPYPGRKSGVDPVEYLVSTYGQEIAHGQLGPGQLHVLDQNLYLGVRQKLAQMKPPLSLADFLDSKRSPTKHGAPTQRRISACAQLLDSNEEAACKFFGNLRGVTAEKQSCRRRFR